MRSLLIPFVSLALLLSASANPALSPWTLHEKRSHIPGGWSQTRKYHSSADIPLRFALTQSNINDLESHLYDVSHPHSANYGKHWTPAEIAAKFAPSSDSVDAVYEWLLQSGVEPERITLSPTKGWIQVSSSVEEAEQLLRTEYHVYGHESGKEHVACESYHLPAHVTPHIDFVTPTIHFDAKISKRSTTHPIPVGAPGQGITPKTTGQINNIITHLEDCDQQITPECLRALYGFYYEPVAADKNSFGIVEYTPNAYIQSDLDSFAKNFSTGLEGISPILISIDGGIAQQNTKGLNYNGESNLDLEYAMTLVTAKQNVTLYQVGDLYAGASFNNFLDALDGTYCNYEGGDNPAKYPDPNPLGYQGKTQCGTVKPANVISTSYGYNEADLSLKYTARQCNEYAKLGLMGVTILYSSGDYGVAGGGNICLNPDGVQNTTGKIFNPTFPATCPYITAVGGTQVVPGKSVSEPESACEKVFYSGGGFSNHFAMPDYQKSAVTGYLSQHPPAYPSSIWNSTGSRGFPDLAANAANYVVAIDGSYSLVFGTSAAAPVVGAMLTMVNDARIALGKSTIGFINPVIYASNFTGSFHDITNGTNQGCGTDGYSSATGWDPVTGLGTPNFPVMLANWLLH